MQRALEAGGIAGCDEEGGGEGGRSLDRPHPPGTRGGRGGKGLERTTLEFQGAEGELSNHHGGGEEDYIQGGGARKTGIGEGEGQGKEGVPGTLRRGHNLASQIPGHVSGGGERGGGDLVMVAVSSSSARSVAGPEPGLVRSASSFRAEARELRARHCRPSTRLRTKCSRGRSA